MRDFFSRRARIQRLLARKDFVRIRKTHWCIWLPLLAVPAGLAALFPWIHYAGDALRWFVFALQIPQILKAQILEEKDLYSILSYLLYGYIAFAVFLDLARYVRKFGRRDLVLTDHGAYLIEWLFTGPAVTILPDADRGRVEIRTGFFRKLLGLERVFFHFPDRTLTSPLFSRWRGENSETLARLL